MPETNTTVGALVDATLGHLLGAAREEMNRLTSNIGATDTTISVDFAVAGMVRGTYLGIDDEVVYVWSSTLTPSQAVVQRGMKGTVPAPHQAGALIKVNPYFTRYDVRQALKDEIRSWGPQVFAVRSADIPVASGIRGYDLGNIAPFYFVLQVWMSPDVALGQLSSNAWTEVPFHVIRSGPTTAYPSGQGLIISQALPGATGPIASTSSGSFHIVYAAPFDVDDSFDDTTDLLTTVGVDISDLDIAPYGAAWRLVGFREVRRTFTEAQGEPSDLQAEPNMASARTADWLRQQRDSRLNDAVIRLRSQYPARRA